MIIIQSTIDDISTNDVLDWLYFWGFNDIVRINDETQIARINIDKSSTVDIVTDGITKKINATSYWYRRGRLKSESTIFSSFSQQSKNIISPLTSEIEKVFATINIPAKCTSIGKYSDNFINKIDMLSVANQVRLLIPPTLITGKKRDILLFIEKHKIVITKAIDKDVLYIPYNHEYIGYLSLTTKIVSRDIIDDNVNYGLPALFQKYIEKKFELRIFYLQGTFYSMAIFSQQNKKTELDFRNYDDDLPNRCVPYQLPKEIEEKLNQFMKLIRLDTGSIDMIFTPQEEYVFLEVNPIGQYQWLEKNCNYPISEHIAKLLTKNE